MKSSCRVLREEIDDPPLRGDLFAQLEIAVAAVVEETALHILHRIAEALPQEMPADVGAAEAVVVEMDPALADLVDMDRHRRIEVTHDALDMLVRHLPDPEEAEDVIDPIGIEVMTELREPRTPPGVVVLLHDLPVVGGKSPVLALHGEGVRRRAGLRVHLEQMRRGPRVHRLAVDADRQVALERESMLMQMARPHPRAGGRVRIAARYDRKSPASPDGSAPRVHSTFSRSKTAHSSHWLKSAVP